MKLTDRLKVEHGIFLRQLRYLDHLLLSRASKAALATAADIICRAEEQHAALEDRVLYPEMAKALGEAHPTLRLLAEDHDRIRELVAKTRSGEVEEDCIRRLVHFLRAHMEREIHQVFPLAEQLLSEITLNRLSNWDVEHVHEEVESGERS
jgi:hemerythrin-like domain-containing protein